MSEENMNHGNDENSRAPIANPRFFWGMISKNAGVVTDYLISENQDGDTHRECGGDSHNGHIRDNLIRGFGGRSDD
jgi:hypothetical protein